MNSATAPHVNQQPPDLLDLQSNTHTNGIGTRFVYISLHCCYLPFVLSRVLYIFLSCPLILIVRILCNMVLNVRSDLKKTNGQPHAATFIWIQPGGLHAQLLSGQLLLQLNLRCPGANNFPIVPKT